MQLIIFNYWDSIVKLSLALGWALQQRETDSAHASVLNWLIGKYSIMEIGHLIPIH